MKPNQKSKISLEFFAFGIAIIYNLFYSRKTQYGNRRRHSKEEREKDKEGELKKIHRKSYKEG